MDDDDDDPYRPPKHLNPMVSHYGTYPRPLPFMYFMGSLLETLNRILLMRTRWFRDFLTEVDLTPLCLLSLLRRWCPVTKNLIYSRTVVMNRSWDSITKSVLGLKFLFLLISNMWDGRSDTTDS